MCKHGGYLSPTGITVGVIDSGGVTRATTTVSGSQYSYNLQWNNGASSHFALRAGHGVPASSDNPQVVGTNTSYAPNPPNKCNSLYESCEVSRFVPPASNGEMNFEVVDIDPDGMETVVVDNNTVRFRWAREPAHERFHFKVNVNDGSWVGPFDVYSFHGVSDNIPGFFSCTATTCTRTVDFAGGITVDDIDWWEVSAKWGSPDAHAAH